MMIDKYEFVKTHPYSYFCSLFCHSIDSTMFQKLGPVFCLIFLGFLASCGSENHAVAPEADENIPCELAPLFDVSIKYSKGFSFDEEDGFRKITVYDPWQKNKIREVYLLVPKECEAPKRDDVTIVRTPVESIIPFSTTHIGFMQQVGQVDKIIGVFDGKYVYNELVRTQLDEHDLPELGSLDQLDFERTIMLDPDIVMISGSAERSANLDKLSKSSIAIIQNIEWMESHPLARAEWVKFVAAFFDKDSMADEFFNTVEANYLETSKLSVAQSYSPSILLTKSYQGTWFMPGGKSFMAQLLADAGADYFYKDDSSSGSLKLNPETVVENQLDADIWLNPGTQSLADLESIDSRYTSFKAFKTGEVYGNTKRTNEFGGNDYWETGTSRPDLILKDLVKIFHPDLLPDYESNYYHQIPQEKVK